MKTGLNITEYRKIIKERLVKTISMDAMRHSLLFQNLMCTVTGKDV